MRKVYFEYRQFNDSVNHCIFIATHTDGRTWEIVTPKPYPNHHDFWDEDQHSSRVTKVSRRIAREEGAPEWVLE